MANKGFYCMDGYLKRTERLTDEEVGRLFRACMIYHATGELVELDGRESIAFDFIREDIDAANDAYAAKCETNRRNRNCAGNDEKARPSTTDDETARPLTTVDDRPRPSTNRPNIKEKEKENIKENNKGNGNARARALTDPAFDAFWAQYPNKKAKQDAEKAWQRIKPDDALAARIMAGLEKAKASDGWQRDDGRYIPHPATWLNGRRWEDEVTPATGPGNRSNLTVVPAQQYKQRDYSSPRETIEEMMTRLNGGVMPGV